MADSKSEAVGDAVKAAVEALGLTGLKGVVKRKKPDVPEGDTVGLPQAVVSVGEEGKTEYLTAVKKLKTYPAAVTIVTGGGMKAADDAQVRQWREQIERKLESYATWSGFAGWNETNITNKAPFDASALSKDFNYSTVVADVQVIETKG